MPAYAKPLTVAYILGTFPQLTQTFVTRELFWIRASNVRVQIFSLHRPDSPPADEQVTELMPFVHYSHLLSWALLSAHLYFLFRSPGRYLHALRKVIWLTYREPLILLQALALFPKSVHFARQIQQLDVDHVHAHFITLAAISASVVSELLGITYSVHAHAVGLFKRDQENVRRQLEDASQVITISTHHRAYIADLCPGLSTEDVGVVYCSLETGHFRPAPKANGSGPFRIFSVGRLIEKKGFEYLIEACALLADEGLDLHCNIAGSGPLQKALQARINDHRLQDQITLLGAIDQARILELYQESEAFALACVIGEDGNRDGLPVVLVEAMSCGLPVVSTPVAGITDLIHPGQTGLLVKPRDSADLAEAIRALMKDKQKRIQLGKQARQKVLADFQIQQNTARLAAVFRQAAGNSRSEPLSDMRRHTSDQPA